MSTACLAPEDLHRRHQPGRKPVSDYEPDHDKRDERSERDEDVDDEEQDDEEQDDDEQDNDEDEDDEDEDDEDEDDEDEDDEDEDELEDQAESYDERSAKLEDTDTEDDDHDAQAEQDAEEEAEPDRYGSLEELAAAIDDAHGKSRRGHELSNQHALRAGEYLLVVKERVGHGRFGRWVTGNVKVSHRQAERYMELFEGREELDQLHAEWQSLWSVSEALARLAELRHGEDDDPGDPGPAGAEEGTAEDAQPEEEHEAPRLTAKQLRRAKSAHRQRVKQLPEFLKAEPIKFGRNSAGLAALQEVGVAYVKAARQVARRLHSTELEQQGFDVDLIAMALVELLPHKLSVDRLFQPRS